MTAVPWYAEEDYAPPGVRQLGDDARMVDALRSWTRGGSLTAGVPAQPWDEDRDGGSLWISYHDEHRPSWAIAARQRASGRDIAVYGYSSLVSALEDCLGMARDYEREDLLYLAPIGLA